MSTQTSLDFAAVLKRRSKTCQNIVEFFCSRIGEKVPSSLLHIQFGTAVRSRISDINREVGLDAAPIIIRNVTVASSEGIEKSYYIAQPRGLKESIQ